VGRVFFGNEFATQKINGSPLTTVLADTLANNFKYTREPLAILTNRKAVLNGWTEKYRKLQSDIDSIRHICT